MQPMFPDGERKVARCTTGATPVAVVDVVEAVLALEDWVAGVLALDVAAVAVDVVTVTVFVCVPQAASATATTVKLSARMPHTSPRSLSGLTSGTAAQSHRWPTFGGQFCRRGEATAVVRPIAVG